jgi:hypothetical protein
MAQSVQAPPALFIPEILAMILTFIRDGEYTSYITHMLNTQASFDDVVALDLHAVSAQGTLNSTARTCRRWNAIATEFLYKRAIITSPGKLWLFAGTISSHAHLAHLVNAILLLDTPQESANAVPPLAHLASGEPSRIRGQTSVDLVRALRSATNLCMLGAHYGREESLFCTIKGAVFSALSEITTLRQLTIDGTFSYPVVWLAQQDAPLRCRGLERLEELALHELFCDLRGLELPALKRLLLRGCRCQHISWIVPDNAPLLQDINLTDNLVLDVGHEVTARSALAKTARTLQKVTLKGTTEWKWFRSGDWSIFKQVRYMIVGSSNSTARVDCRHTGLPPTLKELVIFQLTSRIDIHLNGNMESVNHAFDSDAASHSCWGHVRIDASRKLADQAQFITACQRLRHACKDYNVSVHLYGYG